jgi:hypothetical protein
MMSENKALIKTSDRQPQINGQVRLTPMNEGHEIAYCESFEGIEAEIFARTKEILDGLTKLFPTGTWIVKIESNDVREAIYIDHTNIYAEDFEVIKTAAEKFL